jgi:hypothetical protein
MQLTTDQLNLLNVIGTWLGGVGSIAASIVALWLAGRMDKPRAKISAQLADIYIDPVDPRKSTEVVRITVTNLGDRRIVVSEIGWIVGLFKKEYVYQRLDGVVGVVPLPHILEHGETQSWIIHVGEVHDAQSWVRTFTEVMLRGRGKLGTLTLRTKVSITTGKIFLATPGKSLIRRLKWALQQPSPTF